jgi:hypothetical protein
LKAAGTGAKVQYAGAIREALEQFVHGAVEYGLAVDSEIILR